MRSVSNAFIQALANDNRNYQCTAELTLLDNTHLTLTNSELWIGGVEFDDNVSDENSFTALGSTVINSVSLTVNNIYEDFSSYDFIGAQLVLYIGLTINTSVESVKIGTFIVDDVTTNGALLMFKCLDHLSKFDKVYTDGTLTYPTTLGTLLSNICTTCGVTLNTTTFPNSTLAVATSPATDTLTCRELVSYIAVIAGCFVKCTANGQLKLDWFTNNHSISALSSINFGAEDVTITGVEIVTETSVDAEVTSVSHTYGTAGYLIKIENNPLITESNVATVGAYLETLLVGLTFRPASIRHLSDPTIEAGDTATVTDRKGNTYNILITNTTFNVSQYQETKCSAEAPAKNSSKRFTDSAKVYTQIQELVKQEKTARQSMGQDLTSAINAKAGMYETRVQESGGGYTYYLHDKPLLANSTAVIKITNEAVGVTADYQASPPVWYGLTVDGNFIANIMSVIGIDFSWGTGGTLTLGGANNGNGTLRILNASNQEIGIWNNSGISLNTGSLRSTDYAYTSGAYSDTGMLIDLTNKIIRTPKFAVTSAGVLYATDGHFSGEITAESGKIGAWDINGYQISYYDAVTSGTASTQYGVFVRSKEDATYAANANTYHFCVYHRSYNGSTYGNWVIDWGVKHDGSFIATKGNIGGFTISSTANTGTSANGGHVYTNSLYRHTESTAAETGGMYAFEYEAGLNGGGTWNDAAFYVKRMIKNSQWSTADPVFYVRNDGLLYATSAEIGTVWDITTGYIKGTNSTDTLRLRPGDIYCSGEYGDFSITPGGSFYVTDTTNSGTTAVSIYAKKTSDNTEAEIYPWGLRISRNGSTLARILTYAGSGGNPDYAQFSITGNMSINGTSTSGITNNTSKTYITYNTNLMTTNTLAYWDGSYNSSGNSNLSYLADGCRANGAFWAWGNVYSKMSNYTRGTAPSSAIYRGFEFKDSADTRLGIFEVGELTDGNAELHMYLSTPNTGTGLDQHGIILKKTSAGALSCTIQCATTVSGNVTATGTFYRKLSGYTRGTAPSSAQYGSYCFVDKNGADISYIQQAIWTNGNHALRFCIDTPSSGGGSTPALVLEKNASAVITCSIAGNTTVSGSISSYINSATSTTVSARNSVGHVQLYMASNGNMGVYSATDSKYLIYKDSNGQGYISFPIQLTGALQTSGNINIYNNSATSYAVGVQNSKGKVQLYMASDGKMGVYDATNSRWIIQEDTSGYINMPRIYANTTTSAVNVVCLTSSGTMYRYSSSSKRYKHSITPLTDWKRILDIPVVSFIYNKGYISDKDQRFGQRIPGFIAEDVDKYYPIATEKPDGKIEDWNIRYIVPPMLAVEQDHEKRIHDLETEINELKNMVQYLLNRT